MKTRILAIAPYQGLKEMMSEIGKQREDIELTIRAGNLEHALEIVREYDPDDFDIIISRGGTANLLAANTHIPTVEINISIYDILRAVRLAENYTRQFAIIGYPAITDCAKMLCDLLKYDIDIITIDDTTDIYGEMRTLRSKGCEMVVCDMIGTTVAYDLGINFILITSGSESIVAAFDQAVYSARLFSHYRQEALAMKSAIVQSRESLFIYTLDGDFIMSSLERSDVTQTFFSYVEKNLDSFLADHHFRLEERVGSLMFSLYSRRASINGTVYVYIYMHTQDAPILVDELGVSLYNKGKNSDAEITDFYGSANFIGETRNTLEKYAATLSPILILGEAGTGKDKCAYFLYEHSEYQKRPYFIIDCAQTNQKKLDYLTENVNSPLNDLHTTIYIKNMQALDEMHAAKFLSALKQGDFCSRNRFLFSFMIADPKEEGRAGCQFLMNAFPCLVLRLLPLRERTEDIPRIATLYIGQANTELGRQIMGFDDDALELMKNFSWEQNLTQLKRIVHQLIVLTDGYYISADLVRQVLKQESPRVSGPVREGYELININQPLDAIENDIVRIVLEKENMNKSRAVERLKISRSTLWRMLQR